MVVIVLVLKNFIVLIYPSFIRKVVDPNELLKTAIAKAGYTGKVKSSKF